MKTGIIIVLFVYCFCCSLYISGCPWTHCVNQPGLEVTDLPASTSSVLELKVCAIMPGNDCFLYLHMIPVLCECFTFFSRNKLFFVLFLQLESDWWGILYTFVYYLIDKIEDLIKAKYKHSCYKDREEDWYPKRLCSVIFTSCMHA